MEEEQTNELKYSKADLVKMPKFSTAIVTNVELKTSKEVFGDKATVPDQKVIVVTYVNDGENIRNNETYTHYPFSNVPEKSKLGRFINRYDTLSIGIKVDLSLKASGYYGIVLD